jgi:eukaryotic-like serine/threonine-protein kinase
MPRVTCGKCSRELEYSGGDRPMFCAYCGQSLGTSTPSSTDTGLVGQTTELRVVGAEARGDATVDFVPRAGQGRGEEVLSRVKGYRLIRQLGRGGMGTVYEAEDSRHGRKVALKIIAPGYVDSASAVDRFRQEGRLASSLAHPRCVFVLEADEDDDGRPFIAMELMTGDTLQDLVEKNGPLEVGDAVSKILDVVEGLAEAHRLGLIHRDVKPSNCFLDGDGRVKVGDFGLSKSQVGSANHLTRTGAFLGTPLYASPEQIKVEPLDARTDVYSTAATLFYLLTGRAPFDKGDASATMARIVTEAAPSAREKRPEVPVGLDRAIRKALERDRDRRTRDLGEFVEALQPFAPGHARAAKLGLRIGAYLADSFAITLATVVLVDIPIDAAPWVKGVANFLIALAYFAVGDGVFGASPGKRLLRMRVTDVGGREPAGLAKATLRALVFLALGDLPLLGFLYLEGPGSEAGSLLFAVACVVAEVAGLGLLAAPMRRSEEGRGLHDVAAGSRVVGRPRGERRLAAGSRRAIGRDRGSVTRPVGVMQSVGPYKVRGAVRWEPDRRVVAGEDPTLGREAWIVIRPKGSPAPEPARREVGRATRPRWLAGGEQTEGRWDAYVAPAGCPIADLAGPEGLPWHDARPILEDLADELAAACAEGTLPPGLTVDQVWVQPDGRAILVDPLGIAGASADPANATDDERALALLRKVVAVALEGGRRRLNDPSNAIKSPVPLHASALLGRLLGGVDALATVAAFRDEIGSTRHLPTEVTVGQRATQLGILGMFAWVGILAMSGLIYLLLTKAADGWLDPKGELGSATLARMRLHVALACGVFFAASWMAWDFFTRGGFSLNFAGLGLARWDGRPAPRWRCAWRSLVVWVPVFGLLVASVWAQEVAPTSGRACWVIYGLALALLPIYAASALYSPSCGPHDRLSGLRVVPR